MLDATRVAVVAAVASVVVARAGSEFPHFRLQPVADGVFAAIATDGSATSNAAIVDLGDSALVFDTFMTPEAARDLRRAATEATGHDIRWVVNSHVHDDHVGGNEVFADLPILATSYTRSELPARERESIDDAKKSAAGHEREAEAALAREKNESRRAELAFWRSYYDAQRLALPTIHVTAPDRSVDREQTLSGSRRTVRLIPVGAAHTKSDLIAFIPDVRVVLAGDVVFSRAHPYMPDGSVDGWLAALARIRRLAPRAIVPGHGPVGGVADVDAMSEYIVALRHTGTMTSTGAEPSPSVPSRFAGWWFERFYAANLKFVVDAAPNVPAAPPVAPPDPAGRLDRAIAAEMTRRGGIGASVAVVEGGRIVLARSYGQASLAPPAPVGDGTLFAVGSVTKQFTSAAILMLAEEGRLSVQDKVATYYPDLARASDITLLDLMNHVSGYRDYYPLDFVDRRMTKPIAADDLLRQYAAAPLDFDPGTRWSYSNTGFILLGRIVEKVTSRPFGSFLAERIFGPAGMRHTVFEPVRSDQRLAHGYTSFALTPPEPAVPEASGWVGAAGGIYSTASDLAAWDLALMQGRLLKPASWALMTTPRVLADGTSTGYGCGLRISGTGLRQQHGDLSPTGRQQHGDLSPTAATVLSHGGAVSGFIASNTMIPDRKSAVVVLLNDEDAGLMSAIVQKAMADVLPAAPGAAQANAAARDRAPHLAVAGPSPAVAAGKMFGALQRGRVDRSALGEEYSVFLTDAKVAAASKRLAPFGRPVKVDVRSVAERGGMEVARVRLRFASGALDALMYRSPDGKIQEFLVNRP